jgi:hypothetical protein
MLRQMRAHGCRCRPTITQALGAKSGGWAVHEVGCPLGDEFLRLNEAGLIPGVAYDSPPPCPERGPNDR